MNISSNATKICLGDRYDFLALRLPGFRAATDGLGDNMELAGSIGRFAFLFVVGMLFVKRLMLQSKRKQLAHIRLRALFEQEGFAILMVIICGIRI